MVSHCLARLAVVAIACSAALLTAGAAVAQFGTCANCAIVNGCQVVCADPNFPTCLTQSSGMQTMCTPGAVFQADVCLSGDQPATCTYTCNSDGTAYSQGDCAYSPINTHVTTYCDYGAGCPSGSDGTVFGKPVRVYQWCTGGTSGVSSEVVGGCGDGGCALKPRCQPGKPCPTETPYPTPRVECVVGQTKPDACDKSKVQRCVPDGNGGAVWTRQSCECTPGQEIFCPGGVRVVCGSDGRIPVCPAGTPPPATCVEVLGTPSCYPKGDKWACTWKGVEVVVESSCPTVERDPFPRGLVGVPMTFRITGGIGASAANGATWACDEVHPENNPPGSRCPQPENVCSDGRYVTGVRGSATFYSTAADFGNARWLMDDRIQNIGMRSEDIVSPYPAHGGHTTSQLMGGDLTIRDERIGATVRHIYETSSYDKPANGPLNNWPAYQVQVKTKWHLVSSWQYQVREWEDYCVDNSSPPAECTCDKNQRPDCAMNHRSRPKYVWYPGPTVIYDADVLGARESQDPARSNICAVVPVGIVQSQAVLGK